ncbi:MAG: NAD(P)/FAD-dependent oxidoreductase [Novosphingobium sp.]|nr:NAD(P)/FAD-dependent oxidoreductase [Novosphingobium sp.]
MGEETGNFAEIHRKYREERDNRLQVEGRAAYVLPEGELADKYDNDPWAETDGARDPVSRDIEVLIVGGGIGGLLAGGNVRQHGVPADEVCIIERGADFGGTWYWNRYPGLSCDTESHCYLPLLEETGYVPKEKYSHGPELFEHCQRVGRHFGLYERALFQTRIISAEWDEEAMRWIVVTDRGDKIRARFMMMCAGATNVPKLPSTPGLSDFAGHSFHTMRWDYDYTGGGSEGGMANLADKRVGVIGTGCTAIQCVPPLAKDAKELLVFQRTPSAVNPRGNGPTDPAWAANLKPGWQMHRMENFLNILSGLDEGEDLVDDAWTRDFAAVTHYLDEHADVPPAERQELLDMQAMEKVRARIDREVTDPATAEALKPWYGLMCKRPTFHDSYLKTFNRDNVTLVDTKGRGVERIVADGIVANGELHKLDCIVFATGFYTGGGMLGNWGFDPLGSAGERLSARWAREFSTLHGIHVSGFPNMFVIGSSQGVLATTRTYDMMIQTELGARVIEHCRNEGLARAEVTPAGEQRWQEEMAAVRLDLKQYYLDCTPGLFNIEGSEFQIWDFYYGGGPVQYRRVLDDWFPTHFERDMAVKRG